MLVSSPGTDLEDGTGTRVKQELVVEQSLRGNLRRDLEGKRDLSGRDCSINCFFKNPCPSFLECSVVLSSFMMYSMSIK